MLALNIMPEFAHISDGPIIFAATGAGVIATTRVTLTVPHPLVTA
jgi:hypothetical protein